MSQTASATRYSKMAGRGWTRAKAARQAPLRAQPRMMRPSVSCPVRDAAVFKAREAGGGTGDDVGKSVVGLVPDHGHVGREK